jgi:hypothetical protein
MHDEERLDQIGRRQLMLAHQLANRGGPPAAAGSVGGRKGHGGKTRERLSGPQPQSKLAVAGWHVLCRFHHGRTLYLVFPFMYRRA